MLKWFTAYYTRPIAMGMLIQISVLGYLAIAMSTGHAIAAVSGLIVAQWMLAGTIALMGTGWLQDTTASLVVAPSIAITLMAVKELTGWSNVVVDFGLPFFAITLAVYLLYIPFFLVGWERPPERFSCLWFGE